MRLTLSYNRHSPNTATVNVSMEVAQALGRFMVFMLTESCMGTLVAGLPAAVTGTEIATVDD